ncbi:MAG: serine hydrolase, partial [Oscillospiraceae bacterium]|nr:serine hydrolase [Oscillospiraceae bacterium]
GTPTADCISYAAQRGLLRGVENGNFDPEGLVTRAMAVTVLYRMSREEVSPAVTFSDVKAGDWFAPAVAWAAKTEVATGYEDGTFRGALTVTRAQLAALLFRLAAHEGEPVDLSVLDRYRDSHKIPAYAKEPMAWAVENHLFAGMAYDALYPDLPVTRAQLAQMLTALQAYDGDSMAQDFTDALHSTTVTLTAEAHDRIQSAVETAAKNYGAVGMQAAVIHNGRVIDSFATGWATKKTDPMTVDHKLRIASVTKVDIALAAMVLWDEGIIDPEESIGTYWGATMRNPYYKNTPVSIRSILSHTSSIRLFGDSTSLRNSAVRSTLTSSSGYMQAQPGSMSAYGYNNYAFGVLGMTLELAAGKNLNKVMAPVFTMLDMDVSYFSGDIQSPNLHTTLYYHDGSVGRSLSTARGNVHPASPGGNGAFFSGGFTTSAKDQARLVALLANDGKLEGVPLISEEAVAFMETSAGYVDGYYQCYPLRRQDNIYGRDTLYYHTGSAFGVYNLLSYDPDTGDGVVVFTSGASAAKDSRGIYAVCGTVSNTVYDLLKDGNSYAPVND